MQKTTIKSPPPPPQKKLPSILSKLLVLYKAWHVGLKDISKNSRYSLCVKIDALFNEVIEAISTASMTTPVDRGIILERAIVKNDSLKFMMYVLYEIGGISDKKFISYSTDLDEIGRMLYGWKNQSLKQNRPQNENLFRAGAESKN